MTVGDLLTRNAHKFPERTAIVTEGGPSLTYRDLNDRVNRLAAFLIRVGLKRGDRIGVLVHNSTQFVELYFAAAKTGAIFCPYNTHLKAAELTDIVNYCTPRFLFLDEDFGAVIQDMRAGLKSVERYICLQDADLAFTDSYEALLAEGRADEPQLEVTEDDIVSMIFTSGTTGRPKGAMRSHRHLVLNAFAGAIELKTDYDERVLVVIPMYHVGGEDNIVRHTLMANTFCIRREGGFDPAEILGIISRQKITCCQMVPTMVHSLLQVPNIGEFDLQSLRLIIYTGSPMPLELLKRALATFRCGFIQMYGQTESGPVTTVLRPEDHRLDGSAKMEQRLSSTGRPAVNFEIRIVDEGDQDVPVGEVGEIIGRSDSIMKEYWQMPEETAQKLKNGWLHTGDLGRLDADGYVYIVERKNDMIISGGVNIYPREIEEVLYRHPAIHEVSVVGVPDEHWGEVVKAVIVLREGAQLTETEVKEFCGQHLAGYKKPKSVDFWNELPRSPQGKILKKEVRAHYRQ